MKQDTLFIVYRGIFFTETGKLCRASFARFTLICWALLAWSFLATDQAPAQVDLPPPPHAVPPPQIPKGQTAVELRHEEHIKAQTKQVEEMKENQEHREEKRLEEQAKKEEAEPRPMYGFMEVSLLYTKVTTTGSRSNYLADVTTHLNAWGRVNSQKPSENTQLWAGLRVAPFSGSGIQHQHAGRYALTYFGPGVGFGKIQSQGAIKGPADEDARTGWLVSGGLAAVSKLSRRDEPNDPGATDFHATPWAMDAPGVWLEYRAMRVFNAALTGNLVGGAQLAQGKNFLYLGIGFAGWL